MPSTARVSANIGISVAILALLAETHWGTDLTPERLERAIEHSVCFGVYQANRLVGFGRVVTDLATFGYLTDVVIATSQRGLGLGRWLAECMVVHPELQGLRRFCLLTRDAHGLYARYGFKPMPDPTRYMERWDPEVYTRPHEPTARG